MAVRWLLALVLLLACSVGCQGPTEPQGDGGLDDGGPDAASGACQRDADCDDGLFCNGLERCREGDDGVRRCVPGSSPCGPGTYCDERSARCELTCAIDADGDGAIARECGGSDCDDSDPRRYPGNEERCDDEHVDEDCDPTTFGRRDLDGDGWVDARCCNRVGDTLQCGDDCDDGDPGVHRTASEVCDGIDNDCDGVVDERVSHRLWPDVDRDGFGDRDAEPIQACTFMPGYALVGDDCDDGDDRRNPGTHDVCNGVDDDCDGIVDEGAAELCARAPGVVAADCVHFDGEPAPRCVISECGPELLDCNLDPADGCEANYCSDREHCSACAAEGGGCEISHFCSRGRCVPSAAMITAVTGRVVRAVDGAPIAGARLWRVRECGTPTIATTGPDGSYEFEWYDDPRFPLLRVEAEDYVAQVHGTATWDEIRLLEQSELDALLALSPVPANPHLGIVVIDTGYPLQELVEPVSGTYRAPSIPSSPPFTVTLPDGRHRMVYVNVQPGRVRARVVGFGDTYTEAKCTDEPDGTTETPPFFDSYVVGGAVVYVRFGWCSAYAVGG